MDAQIEMLTLQLNAVMATLNEIRGGAALKPTKATKVAKTEKVVRAPTSWGLFRTRISSLLKEHEVPIKLSPEMLQFCSRLKTEKTLDEWTDAAILEARTSWVAPPKKAKTPVESEGEAEAEAEAAEPKKAPKKAKAKAEEPKEDPKVEPKVPEDKTKMEPSATTIGGKSYFVNSYGDVFDETTFKYLGSQKGARIVKGEPPARVVKYLAEADN